MNSLKLRGPCGERIRFVIAHHIPHSNSEQVEVILYSEQLQGILAITVHHFGLQLAQTCYLPRYIGRVRENHRKRYQQAQQQPEGQRTVRRRRYAPEPQHTTAETGVSQYSNNEADPRWKESNKGLYSPIKETPKGPKVPRLRAGL